MTGPLDNNPQGDINEFLLSSLNQTNTRLGTIEGDIKLIKTHIQKEEGETETKHSYLRDITLLGIAAGIATVISFLTGYRS